MQIQSTNSFGSTGQNVPGVQGQPQAGIHRAATPSERLPKGISADQKTATDSKQTAAKPSKDEVDKATEKMQNFVDSVRGDIRFSIDEDSGKTVVKVIDRETQEVLKQFPSEEALELAKALDKFQGILVKQQV